MPGPIWTKSFSCQPQILAPCGWGWLKRAYYQSDNTPTANTLTTLTTTDTAAPSHTHTMIHSDTIKARLYSKYNCSIVFGQAGSREKAEEVGGQGGDEGKRVETGRKGGPEEGKSEPRAQGE